MPLVMKSRVDEKNALIPVMGERASQLDPPPIEAGNFQLTA